MCSRIDADGRSLVLYGVVLLAVLALAGSLAPRILGATLASQRLPMWDMAEHGVEGVRLADALRSADPWAFVKRVNAMALWPPGFPLLECPVFLVFGYDYAVPRVLVGVLFIAVIVAAYACGAELGGHRGILVGGLTAALVAASPFLQLYATVVMLEIPGVLALFIAMTMYLRFQRTRSDRDLVLAGLAALALFFIKYNYGLMWIVPAALHEMGRPPTPGAAWRAAHRGFTSASPRRRAFVLFLIAYGVFMLAIVISGGWVGRIAGQRISVQSLGNPAYLLLAVLLIRFALRPRHNAGWIRHRLVALNRHQRLLLLVVGVPIALWLLNPTHMKNFFNFVQNRSSDMGFFTADSLLYYPQRFIQDYSPSPLVGLIVLSMGCITLVRVRGATPGLRVLQLALAFGLLAALAHPLKETRFLITVAPLIWLACAHTIARAVDLSTRRLAAGTAAVIAVLLALGALAWSALHGADPARLEAGHERLSSPVSTRPVLDALATAANAAQGTVVLGLWNGLSPALVEWHTRLQIPGVDEARIPQWVRWDASGPDRFVGQLAARSRLEQILLLTCAPPGPVASFEAENRPLPLVLAALENDPNFTLIQIDSFPASGYQVHAYRRQGGNRAAAIQGPARPRRHSAPPPGR